MIIVIIYGSVRHCLLVSRFYPTFIVVVVFELKIKKMGQMPSLNELFNIVYLTLVCNL